MRILHVMASGARGGGADHLLGLLPALAAQGLDCSALVGSDGDLAARLRAAGIDCGSLDLMPGRLDPRAAWRLWRRVRASGAERVHYHGTRAAFYGALPGFVGRPWRQLYTAHGLAYRKEHLAWRRHLFTAVEALACRGADRVLSVAAADLESLRGNGCLAATAGLHVPNAVNSTSFRPATAARRAAARARLGLPAEGLWIGTTARLVPQKAVADLLAALALQPALRLVVLGDGPLRSQLAAHPAVRSGCARLLGARDDVADCLPAIDVFALASHWEGEPIALLEAMACGLPWVASRTAGAAELAAASGTGVLVDVAAPAQLAAALTELLADRPARRHQAEAGRSFALGRSHAAQARTIAAIYRAL